MTFLKPLAVLLTLALLMSAAPLAQAAGGPGDDDDGKKEPPAASVLPLRALMLQPLPPPGAARTAPALPLAAHMRSASSVRAEPTAAVQARSRARSGSAGRYVHATGNTRFPAWNLPPQVGNQASFYANVAYGQIKKEFDSSGDMRSLGEDVPQFAGPIGFNDNGQPFRVDGEIVGQPQLPPVSLRQAAELVEGLDPANIPDGVTGQVYAGGRLRGTVNTYNVNVGGSYNFLNSPTFSVGIGADFQASQQNFQTDDFLLDASEARASIGGSPTLVTIGTLLDLIGSDADVPDQVAITPDDLDAVPESVDSGFQVQALTLFLHAQNQLLSLRTGFQFDLGPSPKGSQQREVSDRQNALLLGLTLNYPVNPKLRTYFGVDGWFTLPTEEDQRGLDGTVIEGLEDLRYDEGNTYATQLGADYALPFLDGLAVGAGLTFRWRTRAVTEEAHVANPEVIGDDDPDTEVQFERRTVVDNKRGYHLGIAPYLNYAPPGQPFTLYAKGGVRDEYREFSFSLLGENEFAPRAGVTLGAVYRF